MCQGHHLPWTKKMRQKSAHWWPTRRRFFVKNELDKNPYDFLHNFVDETKIQGWSWRMIRWWDTRSGRLDHHWLKYSLLQVLHSTLSMSTASWRNHDAGSTPRSNFHVIFENNGLELWSGWIIFIISSLIVSFKFDWYFPVSSLSIFQPCIFQKQ